MGSAVGRIIPLGTGAGAVPHEAGRRSELVFMVILSLVVLVFWGSRAEGQVPLFDRVVSDYIVERAAAIGALVQPNEAQLAADNSFSGNTGGFGGPEQPRPTGELPTTQESTALALTPPEADYLDQYDEKRNQVVEVTVLEGDLLSFIASDYGVSIASIIWANGLKDADSISPGQILRIPPVNGVVHKVKAGETVSQLAKKYAADAEKIFAFNGLPLSGALVEDTELIIPDGRMPSSPVQATGVARATTGRAFSYLPNLGDYFRIPTTGYNWGRIHGRNGVDIANSCGTAVYTAADGVVTVADADGYNGGFGKYIKISHPNGTETLYAHSSKLLVSPGQAVAKGQQIMLMGTTGRSTGCHLHLEVHGARNPLAKY